MALPRWCRDTITVVRPTLVDDYGSQVPDWSAPTRTVVTGCSVQPAGGADDILQRIAGITSDLKVLCPPGTDVVGTDRIEVQGRSRAFEVIGEPGIWRSPTGRVSHIDLTLKVTEG